MQPVLRRIAIHGGMAAIVLGIVGLMFAELASIWIVVALPAKGQEKGGSPDTTAMKQRLPLFMAIAGFAFVAFGELVLIRVRKNRIPPIASTPPESDQTEKLLQELLAKEEAKVAALQQGMVPPSQENSASSTPPSNHVDGGK